MITAGTTIERTPVDETSQVASARAMVVLAARRAGMTVRGVDAVALAATELSENLHRHANRGELVVLSPAGLGGGRLGLLAIDRGPGVDRFEDCLVDGYSTAGTMGTGLGAVRRLAADFDAVSEPGLGTVVSAGFVVPGDARPQAVHFDVGAVGFPLDGELRNGDAFAIVRRGSRIVALVADGLGHGDLAAEASERAAAELPDLADLAPAPLVTALSRHIAGTRGAALSIASLDLHVARAGGVLMTAGLGNVSLMAVRPDGASKRIATAHGTAGVHRRGELHEMATDFPARGLLIMHTDGLTTRWALDGRAELLRHSSLVIAAALWRDHGRGTDDSMVVVIRAGENH